MVKNQLKKYLSLVQKIILKDFFSIEKVLDLSNYFLSKNGFLIAKIFQGGAQGDLIKKMNQTLSSIRYFKPKASRAESPETYLVAQKK